MHEIKSVPGQGSVTLYIYYSIHTDKETQNSSYFWVPYKAKFEGTHGILSSFKVSKFT